MREETNSKPETKTEQEEKLKINEEQYKLLLSCSNNNDIKPWNKYRKENPDEKIWLQGAEFPKANLQFVNLEGANLKKANLQGTKLNFANLNNTEMYRVNLQRADLLAANLKSAIFYELNQRGEFLRGANLQDANLNQANLQNAQLGKVDLKDAFLWNTNLQNAELFDANLQNAGLVGAHLQGANLTFASLQGANFRTAIVDGNTLIWKCKVNYYSKRKHFTDFEGVGLESSRIDPGTKQLLEYNIRRKNWEEWYSKHSLLKWPTHLFWLMSDYGLSTPRIIGSCLLLIFIFATIYFGWGCVDYYHFGIKNDPGIVKELFIAQQTNQQISDFSYCLMIGLRSVCLSVATMFTFGDISVVNPQFGWKWWFAHIIPIFQMVLGYMLLGALITRLAILFTAGGPAGKFAKNESAEKQVKNNYALHRS